MNAAVRSAVSLDFRDAPGDAARALSALSLSRDVELEFITDTAAFEALEDDWNDLFARAGRPTHVFQTFNFCWHWANNFVSPMSESCPGLKISIVTGRRNGRLVMIWPLVSQRVRGITQTFWMGEPVAQYGDALVEAEPDALDILRAGYEFLRAGMKCDLLRLRRVRADSNVAPLLSAISANVADRQVAPYMDLSSAKDFAEFEQRYSGKTRKNRRRLARRLEEKGSVEFVRFHGGEQARALALQGVALKTSWLKDRGLLSKALAGASMAPLFADLAEGKTRPVECIVSALKADGKAAAVEISFTCKGRLAMHLIAFNLEYEKSGAGVLLLEQSLKDGYAEGLGVYDMMAPGDPYKFDWCDRSDEVLDWVQPISIKGYLYAKLYLGFLRGRMKAAHKSMPQPLRRLMRLYAGSAAPSAT